MVLAQVRHHPAGALRKLGLRRGPRLSAQDHEERVFARPLQVQALRLLPDAGDFCAEFLQVEQPLLRRFVGRIPP